MNPDLPLVQIDCTIYVDSVTVFDDQAEPTIAANGVAEFELSLWHGIVECDASVLASRAFTVITSQGQPLPQPVLGHEVETSDPAFIRVIRVERGHRICVGAFDRQQVIGVYEADPQPRG